MNREERIKQFANDMEMFGDYVTEYGVERFDYDKTATELDGLGYHKTIWHKVADGDLPEHAGSYLIICEGGSSPKYYVDSYEHFWYGKRWVYSDGCVIAWAELPKYEE